MQHYSDSNDVRLEATLSPNMAELTHDASKEGRLHWLAPLPSFSQAISADLSGQVTVGGLGARGRTSFTALSRVNYRNHIW